MKLAKQYVIWLHKGKFGMLTFRFAQYKIIMWNGHT